MLKGLPNECGLKEPEQEVLAFAHQLSEMTAPLDLTVLGLPGADSVTRCVSVSVCVGGWSRVTKICRNKHDLSVSGSGKAPSKVLQVVRTAYGKGNFNSLCGTFQY